MSESLTSRIGPVAAPTTLVPRVLVALGLVADRYVVRSSPVGDVFVAYNERGISACLVIDGRPPEVVIDDFFARFGRSCNIDRAPSPDQLAAIDRVLAGAPSSALDFDLAALSAFQRAVLDKAAEIPAGEVRPYGWIAAEIGKPGAVRAVGTALGRNPVPLLIPCHRVVRTDGRIGDYAFGSPAKRTVLTSEGVDPDELERLASRGVRYLADARSGVFCHPTCSVVRGHDDAIPFPTMAAAGSAGFAPCPRCRPLPMAA